MDNILQTIITQIPNLGVAVWMLWQQQQTIKSLLDNATKQQSIMLDSQAKLIDRLLAYIDNDKQAVKAMMQNTSTPTISPH